jgi:hypothetical protein
MHLLRSKHSEHVAAWKATPGIRHLKIKANKEHGHVATAVVEGTPAAVAAVRLEMEGVIEQVLKFSLARSSQTALDVPLLHAVSVAVAAPVMQTTAHPLVHPAATAPISTRVNGGSRVS